MTGFKHSLNAFWELLHNPVYYGKIKVPAFEGRKEYLVNGMQQPIISEALFNRAQEALRSRSRKLVTHGHNHNDEFLPLRGFLHCPNCKRKLTGSGCKGRSKYYYYYHCDNKCAFRVRADRINRIFLEGLRNLVADDRYVSLYKEILRNRHIEVKNAYSSEQAYITKTIKELIGRYANSRELLMKGLIDEEDYRSIKGDCDNRIDTLGKELYRIYALNKRREVKLDELVSHLTNLGLLYEKGDFSTKWRLQELLLDGDLVFNEDDVYKNFRPCVLPIYGRSSKYIGRVADIGSLLDNGADDHDKTFLQRIVNIERQSGWDAPVSFCRDILYFLYDLSSI